MRHDIEQAPGLDCRAALVEAAAGERRLKRFEAFGAGIREQIAALPGVVPQIEDLADSFPALLVAFATGYGTRAKRRRAWQAVIGGRPLREAAALIGLPFWLKKLPAHAFQRPLSAMPDDPAICSRLVSLIPRQPGAVAAWLERVAIAHLTGRNELTLWTAQQYRGTTPHAHAESFLRTQAWCWFSAQTGLRGEQLLDLRWKPSIGARRAAQEAQLWAQRIELDACLGHGIRDTWVAEGGMHGFDFVALRTADDFIQEARAMDNCLDRYADRLANRTVRVFSIRRDGKSIANVEITGHERELGMPAVAQLRSARNRRASMEVWQATYAWLGSQPIRQADASLQIKLSPRRRMIGLEAVWRPYLELLSADARCAFEAAILPTPPRQAAARRIALRPVATSSPSSERTGEK